MAVVGTIFSKGFNSAPPGSIHSAWERRGVCAHFGSAALGLGRVTAKAIVIGLRSDILFPLVEQEFLAAHIMGASFSVIESTYGHDGFLPEAEAIGEVIRQWWRMGKTEVFLAGYS